MRKNIYISTYEGRCMLRLLGKVDGTFRKLFASVRAKRLTPEMYKTLLVGWEEFLDSHMEFLNGLSQIYATEYTDKTRQKKAEICLKEIRQTGELYEVALNSFLGQKLFLATTHTEMCFKLIHEFAIGGDITLDAMLDLTDRFDRQIQTFERNYGELRRLQKKVAPKVTV